MEIGEDEMVGAIFMCNRATKKECFRSKVFGLPSRYTEFVEKVKAGMLLFLFEYEERKLYGVFEAATDGTINISPSAFSKTTGTFPAQVIHKNVWRCYPLTEDEFKDAIRDNYFAPYKFHFGLSHEQVSMLLDLFSQRKLIPKNQWSADYHESYRLENGNNLIRKERSASIDDMNLEASLDFKRAMYNQHSELVHKIHSTDMDLRDHLNRDRGRDRNRDINSDESHTSLDMDSKDRLGGEHTLYTHVPDPVFKNHGDLDNKPYHISQCDYQPHNVIGSTSQLDYFPQDRLHLSPKIHQTYPNYGIESTSVAVARKLVEPKCVTLESHLYSSYPDLDNYRYSSTGYLKESNCNKISADASNLATNFTSASYPLEEFSRTIPLKLPSDNPANLPPLSTERYLNFDYDSLALKYSASNVMDYTPSLDHNANRLGYRKMHPESSNNAYMDRSKSTASMETIHDLTRHSLEPNSIAKEHDIVKRYYTRQPSSEPCDIKGYGTTIDHYRNIYPSEFSNANEYERKSLEVQSETPERRSVFSRLSKTANVDKISSMDDKSPSQLLNILALRKKKWKKIASSPKSSHPSINHGTSFKRSKTWIRTKLIDDGLTEENKESTKGGTFLSVKEIKHRSCIEGRDGESKGYLKDVDLNNFEPRSETTKKNDVFEGFHEVATGVLIKNFKRRSVTQEKTGENAEKGKRRKLIRPSFCNNDIEGIGNEGHLAIEPNKNSMGLSTCKEYLVAGNSSIEYKNSDVSFDQNLNRSIKAEPMGEENNLASRIQNDKHNDPVDMTMSSGFTAKNKKTNASFGQKLNIGIKVKPMEEEHMLLSHTHNGKPNDTIEMAECSGFTAENKKTDASFGQKLNASIKIEPMEEEHMLSSHTHNDKPNDTNEMAGNSGFTAENKKTDCGFGQKLNTSIKVEPMEEEHMLLSHAHNVKPNDTNEVVENSGLQIENKKTEFNFDPKSNARIKVEPIEEEHILTAHTENDMPNKNTEMVESFGRDSEQVSKSSVTNNATVLGKKVASSRGSINYKNVNKNTSSLKETVHDVHLGDTNAERISDLKENVNDVNLGDSNAETFQADFGSKSTKSSKENTDINSFKLSNLCIKTDEVKERLENCSDMIAVKSENLLNLCMKSDKDEAWFKAENGADLMKSSEEDTQINSCKPISLSTTSVENKIHGSEREKNSGTFIDLNEIATTGGEISEDRTKADTAADFY